MAKFKTFPRMHVDVIDQPPILPPVSDRTVLHKPIFWGFAEKGRENEPVYGSYDELMTEFGKATFTKSSKFFHHPNLFLEKALQYQRCFYVRLCSDTAKTGNIVIVAEVYDNSANDGKVYLLYKAMTIDEIITASGNGSITYDLIPTWAVTSDIDGNTVSGTAYPLISLSAKSKGAWANSTGIIVSFDPAISAAQMEEMKTVIYQIGFVEQPFGYDIPISILTKYKEKVTAFSFDKEAIYEDIHRYYGWDRVMKNVYSDLSFDVHMFEENAIAIGNTCLSVESSNELANNDPLMVNLVTLSYLNGTAYSNVVLHDDNEILFDDDTRTYMKGGDDGDVDLTTLESLSVAWWSGTVFPEFKDAARFPCTHIYDSGYTSNTKRALIDIQLLRDDIALTFATQVHGAPANDMATDYSMGATIRTWALLHPESFTYGTLACRTSLFMQCGDIGDRDWNYWVPATFDILIKRSTWHNAIYIKGTPKKLPNSAVTIFNKFNWTPFDDTNKQDAWDLGLNYFQYYDMTSVHYPDYKTIYAYDASLLSSTFFVDYIVYMKHICRDEWAKFSGSEDPLPILFNNIQNNINNRIVATFGEFVKAVATCYQTEKDALYGDSITIDLDIYGNTPNRTWNVLFKVHRNVLAEI